MKTKLVYVLISSADDDQFAEMLALSLHTFRKHNHNAEVLVAMDEPTHLVLERKRSSILEEATPLVIDIPSEYNPMQRSRYIKTTLRKNINGDFLYIDGDTFVVDKLDEIDNTDAHIAMVADLNCLGHFNPKAIAKCQTAGFFNLENEPYFNGGVMFVRDKPIAYEFFDKWHELWKKSISNGISVDQPGLCEANRVLGHPIKELPGIWNYQYRCSRNNKYGVFIRNAKILHYYTVAKFGKVLTFLLNRVKNKGRVDTVVSLIIRNPYILVRSHKVSMFLSGLKNRNKKA
ncbi:MAG: hypothetical protein J6X49_07600 [Victivallales bacterium]|nr:hypothetical protein [Victivallales bacterium]